MKILFQGDSITDADREREDPHNLGNGYPKDAARFLKEKFPEIDFEFIDLGISGNQTIDLVNRLQSDFIDIQPDIVSILIGVNDTWHRADTREWLDNAEFEKRYRTVLEAIKTKTNAKIVMMEQFLLPAEDKLYFREDLTRRFRLQGSSPVNMPIFLFRLTDCLHLISATRIGRRFPPTVFTRPMTAAQRLSEKSMPIMSVS